MRSSGIQTVVEAFRRGAALFLKEKRQTEVQNPVESMPEFAQKYRLDPIIWTAPVLQCLLQMPRQQIIGQLQIGYGYRRLHYGGQ